MYSVGLAKIVFTTYRNIEEFLSPEVADEPIKKADIQADKTIIKGPVEEKDTIKEAFDEGIDPEEQNKKDVSRVVNTNIISAAINGRSEEKVELSEPILYTLEHLQVTCNDLFLETTNLQNNFFYPLDVASCYPSPQLHFPANTKHWPNAGSMLVQRL